MNNRPSSPALSFPWFSEQTLLSPGATYARSTVPSHAFRVPLQVCRMEWKIGWGQFPMCATNQTAFCVAPEKEVGALCRHIPQLRSPDCNLYTDRLTAVLKAEV